MSAVKTFSNITLSALVIPSLLFLTGCYPIEKSLTQAPEPGQCHVTIDNKGYTGIAYFFNFEQLYRVIRLELDSSQSIEIRHSQQSQFKAENLSQNRDDIVPELHAVYENRTEGIFSYSLTGTLEIFEISSGSIQGAFDFEMGGNAYSSLPQTREDYFSIFGEFDAFPE